MKYGALALVAAGAGALWWFTRKGTPAPVAPLGLTTFAPQVAPKPKKSSSPKKGASPKKGETIELEVTSEPEQMTQQVSIIGSCELEDGSEGLLVIDAYGAEQCMKP